jgi:hypothetical protein
MSAPYGDNLKLQVIQDLRHREVSAARQSMRDVQFFRHLRGAILKRGLTASAAGIRRDRE